MSKKRKKPGRQKRLSFHPLDPEEALRGFMQVNPKKVKERERRERAERENRVEEEGAEEEEE